MRYIDVMKNSIIFFLVFALLASVSVFTSSAEEAVSHSVMDYSDLSDDYDRYLTESKLPNAKEEDAFSVKATEYSYEKNSNVSVAENYHNENAALIWKSESGEVSYEINAINSAMYNIDFTYLPLEGNGSDIEYELKIDGEYPFSACKDLKLVRYWVDSAKPTVDEKGNEYTSEQVEYGHFFKKSVSDCNGVDVRSFKFALTKGKHIVTIIAKSQPFALSEISFSAPMDVKNYEQYISDVGQPNAEAATPIIIEAEDAYLKSSRSMPAFSDNSSAKLSPSSAFNSKLNYIGGANWNTPGAELVWKFRAEESGWYKLGFSYKQDTVINGKTYRLLCIDGKVPFEEAEKIGFEYSTSWKFKSFANDSGEDYLIYLTEGEHTLSMTVTLGEVASIYKQLKQLIFDMGQMYIDIIIITGEKPDSNRDYNLFKQVPNFEEKLDGYRQILNNMSNRFEEITGEKSNQFVAAFNNSARVITDMIDNPYRSHLYISDFYSQYTTLGSLLSEMAAGPLSLDQIQLMPKETDFKVKSSGFFNNMFFSTKRFLASFSDNYKISFESDDEKEIKIWINWGRDQAMVLDSLIKQSFTPSTGIKVNLEITNASLIKGMLSNTQPDLQLQMSRTEPVNLAMRDALYDLKNFSDYDDVITRFVDGTTVPYTYKNGVYALPDTQSFYLMFYRKDIFEKLNLRIPQTWDEFLDTTADIERNNMTVYLPYTTITSTTTVNAGIGGLNLFPTILQQYGNSVYNQEQNACTLKDPITLTAFTFWTEMYTKYKIPTTQSFYNRFKVGTCPLGIEVYTQYTQIFEAASEIDGNWGIACVPGLKQADGTINRTVSGSGTGCAILNKSKNKEEAWSFLKWWTSAETQLAYNNNVETILGPISRTTTATVEAFEQMSWDKDDLAILLEQRNNIVEIPEIPGGYYLTRSVDQAFWQVINKTKNVKDALVYWGDVSDNEIHRKIKQYS